MFLLYALWAGVSAGQKIREARKFNSGAPNQPTNKRRFVARLVRRVPHALWPFDSVIFEWEDWTWISPGFSLVGIKMLNFYG